MLSGGLRGSRPGAKLVLTTGPNICADMCAGMCTVMCKDMRVGVCAGVCAGMCTDMCAGVCAGVRTDKRHVQLVTFVGYFILTNLRVRCFVS